MNFSEALVALKEGKKVRRNDWPDATIYLIYEEENPHKDRIISRTMKGWFGPDGRGIFSYSAKHPTQEYWQPSQADILREDWMIVGE